MNRDDVGKLILRITVGGLMLFHGIAKLKHGVAPIEGMLLKEGLPAGAAYGVYVGEVLAPVLMIVGLGTRLAAAVLAFNMVVATLMVHREHLFATNPQTGGLVIELELFYLLGAIAVALFGSGRVSVSRGAGRWD